MGCVHFTSEQRTDSTATKIQIQTKMKRDIEFRAYNKVLREIFPNVQNHIGNDVWAFGRMINDGDFVLMQYTGLRDKNGTKVFEGDLLKFKADTTIYVYQVVYENGGFYCYHTAMKDGFGKPIKWGGIWRFAELEFEFKVIGNIYEKPEFIEGCDYAGI